MGVRRNSLDRDGAIVRSAAKRRERALSEKRSISPHAADHGSPTGDIGNMQQDSYRSNLSTRPQHPVDSSDDEMGDVVPGLGLDFEDSANDPLPDSNTNRSGGTGTIQRTATEFEDNEDISGALGMAMGSGRGRSAIGGGRSRGKFGGKRRGAAKGGTKGKGLTQGVGTGKHKKAVTSRRAKERHKSKGGGSRSRDEGGFSGNSSSLSASGSMSSLHRDKEPNGLSSMESMIIASIDLSVIKGQEADNEYGLSLGSEHEQETDLRESKVKFKEDVVVNGADSDFDIDRGDQDDDPPPQYRHLE